MPDVRGRELARTLAMVRKCASKRPLPRTQGLDDGQRIELEDDHIRRSFDFARTKLNL